MWQLLRFGGLCCRLAHACGMAAGAGLTRISMSSFGQVKQSGFVRFLMDTPLENVADQEASGADESTPASCAYGSYHQQYWIDGAPHPPACSALGCTKHGTCESRTL